MGNHASIACAKKVDKLIILTEEENVPNLPNETVTIKEKVNTCEAGIQCRLLIPPKHLPKPKLEHKIIQVGQKLAIKSRGTITDYTYKFLHRNEIGNQACLHTCGMQRHNQFISEIKNDPYASHDRTCCAPAPPCVCSGNPEDLNSSSPCIFSTKAVNHRPDAAGDCLPPSSLPASNNEYFEVTHKPQRVNIVTYEKQSPEFAPYYQHQQQQQQQNEQPLISKHKSPSTMSFLPLETQFNSNEFKRTPNYAVAASTRACYSLNPRGSFSKQDIYRGSTAPVWVLPTLAEAKSVETTCSDNTNYYMGGDSIESTNESRRIYSGPRQLQRSNSWHSFSEIYDKRFCGDSTNKSMDALWCQRPVNMVPNGMTGKCIPVIPQRISPRIQETLFNSVKYSDQIQFSEQNRYVNRYPSEPRLYNRVASLLNTNQSSSVQHPEKTFRFDSNYANVHPPICAENVSFYSPQYQSTPVRINNNNYPSPSCIPQAFRSTACLNEQVPLRRMSRFDRAQSMRFISPERDRSSERRHYYGIAKARYLTNVSSQPSSLNRKIPTSYTKSWAEQLRTSNNSSASTTTLTNTTLANKHRFFLKETPKLNELLSDPSDRRIRAICDRFQCDLEVYSKVPKSGFLQYAIDITAPDHTSMFACARNLDNAFGWCLSPQISPTQRFLVI